MKVVKECKISLELERDEYFIIKNLLEMVSENHNNYEYFSTICGKYFDESDINDIIKMHVEFDSEN